MLYCLVLSLFKSLYPHEASNRRLVPLLLKIMAKPQAYVKSGYYGYPEAKQGPTTPFSTTPGTNPVLRGLPLVVAGSACVKNFPD